MNTDLGTTILLVEDNEDDVFVMRRALQKAQINNPLQIVTDGHQALGYLSAVGQFSNRQEYPLPFIIFLDLKLPYLDGFEVLAWIRQQPALASIVVVVLTSSPEQRDHERAYALGARSYLTKPPTPETVQDVLKSLENYWLSKGSVSPVLLTGNLRFA